MGIAVGDYDNDGYPDIYVTGFPHNVLYHNNRNGTFTDVTAKAGVAAGGWSTSAAFFDHNHDGLPDLYVGRYLDWDYSKNVFCGDRSPGRRSYCHPDEFKCATSRLFRNNGDGTFTETALLAEVALGYSGKPQSGMGTDAADFDGDGKPDLFVTNIDNEPNNLFHNNGDETFSDVTVEQNLGTVALQTSGFGTRFLDFDNDGRLDIAVLNGHVLDNIHLFHETVSFAERPFLLHNIGNRFLEEGASHGNAFQKAYVGRALATGDFDNDGDTDPLWITNGGPPVLLRNDGGNRNSWIGFELVGQASGRDAVGAVVSVTAGGRRQVRQKVGGASYLAAHDQRLLFGLGDARAAERVEIRWPSGAVSSLENVPARQYVRIQEPSPSEPRDLAWGLLWWQFVVSRAREA